MAHKRSFYPQDMFVCAFEMRALHRLQMGIPTNTLALALVYREKKDDRKVIIIKGEREIWLLLVVLT